MKLLKHCICYATFIALVAANAANAQINSAIVTPRVYNDVPGATFTSINNYPGFIVFSETGVSSTNGFANRDVWQFSNNGATAYQFQNNQYFQVTMSLTLTGSPTSPRKEAGFLLDTLGGPGQFIVNTDGHEIVAFGGPLPFYAFPSTFNSGNTITLGMTFANIGGTNGIIYSANGVNSPFKPFTNLELGIINGSTLGGYFQIVNDAANPSNGGSALFQNISIVIPEPSVFALLALGVLPLVFRRRR
jgi:hypothetical protein